MSRYTDVDVNTVGYEDAINDPEWGGKGIMPRNFLKYISFPVSVLQSIAEDFKDYETLRLMNALSLYYTAGLEPDYSSINSSGVKMALRSIISDQEEKMRSEYVKHYKQHIRAIQRRDKQDEQT